MDIINESDLELQLLAGQEILLNKNLPIFTPKLNEIIQMRESIYSQYLSALLFDKNSIEIVDSNEIDAFDLFFAVCYQDEFFRNISLSAIEMIFKNKAQLGSDDAGVFFIFENSGERIDKSNFYEMQRILKKANYIKIDIDKPKAGNSQAQEMIDLIAKNKKEAPKKKETMNLHSIMSGLSWKQNGMRLEDILNLTIYQLYNGFFSTENIDNYDHTITGIYTGNVDGKKIDMSKIHWAKIIN